MNDPESLRRELEAIAKTEADRIAIARQTLRHARWGMLIAMTGALLSAATFMRSTDGIWVSAAVTLFFGLCGYAAGRVDLWLVKKTTVAKVTSKEPAAHPLDWFR